MSFWPGLKTRLGYLYELLASIVVVVFVAAPTLAFAAAYLVARCYLVVESLLQLAHLPDSAYVLPGWSQYYPHIS